MIQLPNGRNIGPGEKPFVIAECCNNFQGSIEIAHAMIDMAAGAGADAVKFQHRRKLSLNQLLDLRIHALHLDLVFLCTAYDREGVEEIAPNVPMHKVGSAELTDLEFLRHVAQDGKPVICSTGAADWETVARAVEALGEVPLCLLQCTSIYPAPLHTIALGVMDRYREAFKLEAVGYSDHTGLLAAPIAALMAGAHVIEVHFTLSKSLPGPDQACSHEAAQLRELVYFARAMPEILSARKSIRPAERDKMEKFRRVPL